MTTIEQLHKPRWQQDGDNWLMIVGNRAVATLIPNSDDLFPQYRWLSVILAESPFDDHGWSEVDFTSLETRTIRSRAVVAPRGSSASAMIRGCIATARIAAAAPALSTRRAGLEPLCYYRMTGEVKLACVPDAPRRASASFRLVTSCRVSFAGGAKRKMPALPALRRRARADAALGRRGQFSFAPRAPIRNRPTPLPPPVFPPAASRAHGRLPSWAEFNALASK